VTSLLEVGVSDREIDQNAVGGFLQFGYIPGPELSLKAYRRSH
jgi:hypothetical protein